MKKIVSFCLWGTSSKYTVGAVKNAELCKGLYCGWEVVFYVSSCTPSNIIHRLTELGCTVINMGSGDWTAMFWRFTPAFEVDTIMISRDTDSRVSSRERQAVEEWLASDKDFHIMRDHRFHDTKILGGMWGCRNDILVEHKQKIHSYSKQDRWGTDQDFLRDDIWPSVKDSSFVHDNWMRYDGGEKRPFPTERVDEEYVGAPLSCEDIVEVPFQ